MENTKMMKDMMNTDGCTDECNAILLILIDYINRIKSYIAEKKYDTVLILSQQKA